MQGILKPELVPPVCLCPKGIVLTPEYPSAHVFGLHYEHAVARDDHMIDLRRAPAGPYRYVIYVDVIGRPQKELRRNAGLEFAEPAREAERIDDVGKPCGHLCPLLGTQFSIRPRSTQGHSDEHRRIERQRRSHREGSYLSFRHWPL